MSTYSHRDLANHMEFSHGVSLSRRAYPAHYLGIGAFDLFYLGFPRKLAISEGVSYDREIPGKGNRGRDHIVTVRGQQIRISPSYSNLGEPNKPVYLVHMVNVRGRYQDRVDHVMRIVRSAVSDLSLEDFLKNAERHLVAQGIEIPKDHIIKMHELAAQL